MSSSSGNGLGRRRVLRLLAGLGVLAVAAPAAPAVYRRLNDDGAGGPPSLRLSADRCDHCGMVISDVEYAAGLRARDGTQAVFDDIGCMLAYRREHGLAEGVEFWVHDFPSKGWIEAEAAWFVRSDRFHTPMSSGYAAFAQEAAARAAAENGAVPRFADLLGGEPHADHE